MNHLYRTLLLLLTITTSAAAQGQPLLYTVPFQSGDGVYRLYRIPAIWLAPSKPVLAFAEGRVATRRATGNIDIVLRRSFDAGQTWQPMQIVADLDADFCGNPCVVQDPTNGRLWLAFTRTCGSDTEEDIAAGKVPGTQVWITYSDDDGATWSKPARYLGERPQVDLGLVWNRPRQWIVLGQRHRRPLAHPGLSLRGRRLSHALSLFR